MIPNIKKILYTTDLSKNSAYAFRYAVNSAMKHNAKIIILHVIEGASNAAMQSYIGDELREKIIRERIEDSGDRIRNRLNKFCELELNNDPESTNIVESIELCEGYPPEVILRKADDLGCDAIVMGTHSKGFLSHTFLGSTAQKVLRRANKPVFIIPLPKEETDITFHDED